MTAFSVVALADPGCGALRRAGRWRQKAAGGVHSVCRVVEPRSAVLPGQQRLDEDPVDAFRAESARSEKRYAQALSVATCSMTGDAVAGEVLVVLPQKRRAGRPLRRAGFARSARAIVDDGVQCSRKPNCAYGPERGCGGRGSATRPLSGMRPSF